MEQLSIKEQRERDEKELRDIFDEIQMSKQKQFDLRYKLRHSKTEKDADYAMHVIETNQAKTNELIEKMKNKERTIFKVYGCMQ